MRKLILIVCLFFTGCSFISDLFIREVVVEKYHYLDLDQFPAIDTVYIPADDTIEVSQDWQGRVVLQPTDYKRLRFNHRKMKYSAIKTNIQIENYKTFINWYIQQNWNNEER